MENTTTEDYKIMWNGSFTDEQYDSKAKEIKDRLNSILKEYSRKGYMPLLKVKERSGIIHEVDLMNKYLKYGEDITEDGKPIYLDPPTYDLMP